MIGKRLFNKARHIYPPVFKLKIIWMGFRGYKYNPPRQIAVDDRPRWEKGRFSWRALLWPVMRYEGMLWSEYEKQKGVKEFYGYGPDKERK